MRALLASSIGVATAALVLPVSLPADAASRDATAPATTTSTPLEGGTQSLPLAPLPEGNGGKGQARGGGTTLGLPAREVEPFSLLGVVWDSAGPEPQGDIQVRTRARETGEWSGWRDLHTHTGHSRDPRSRETLHGTEALWVGAADGVQVRFQQEPQATPEAGDTEDAGNTSSGTEAAPRGGRGGGVRAGTSAPTASAGLPKGMRVELVQPGDGQEGATGVPDSGGAPDTSGARDAAGERDATTPGDTPGQGGATGRSGASGQAGAPGRGDLGATADHVGPRPGIVIRSKWGADESLRERQFLYTNTVKAAFVHHSAGTNNYACSDAPSIIRGMYRYHVKSLGWRDIGYNFLVDKCGTIYEGRAGGVIEPVMGAHTLGFNNDTMGIAVLGSYGGVQPSKQALEGVAKLTAWKLGLFKRNPGGTTQLTSDGGKYAKGTSVKFNVISGHRDGYNTECPGARLYGELGGIRSLASRLQGR